MEAEKIGYVVLLPWQVLSTHFRVALHYSHRDLPGAELRGLVVNRRPSHLARSEDPTDR